ncbi:MAG: helix-turn-helix transcriptional regulator [Leptospirales bacterium]
MKKRPVTIYRQEYIALVDKLIRVRLEAGLKQSEVAEKMGWHQVDVSKVETRVRRLDIMDLADMAKIYDKPLDFFIKHIK